LWQFEAVYSDVNNGSDVFPFQVNQHTGVVSTRRQLDRETDGNYFRFDVTSGHIVAGQFVVSDRVTVEVRLIDRNDNIPTILFPVCGDVDFGDCELDVDVMTLSAGDVITRVIAVDADDVSQQVRYELVGDAAAARVFAINSSSGEVYARQDVEEDLVEGDGLIQLLVRVTDVGSPPLTTSVTFVVRLNVTRHQRLGVNDGPTSTTLALSLIFVAVAAVVIFVICILAARRIRPPFDRSSEIRRNATYMSPSQTSVDDLTFCGADCSTDVVVGSTLRLQVWHTHIFTPTSFHFFLIVTHSCFLKPGFHLNAIACVACVA